jgi:hypothetical protein
MMGRRDREIPEGSMVRILKALAIVLAGIGVLAGAGLVALARYLESEAFRQAVLDAAERALGTEVRVDEMRVSLFSGATLRGVTIANPPGMPGELLRAEALVVRPRLFPLLRRRLEIQEMRLEAPAVGLVRAAGGEWSHQRLGPRDRGAAAATPGEPPRAAEARIAAQAAGLDVVVPRFVLRRGAVAVTGERERPLVRLSGIELGSSLSRVGGAVAGEGELAIEALRVGGRVEARALAGPLRFRGSEVTLAPLRGRLFDGDLAGDLAVHLAAPTRYTASLQVREGRAEALFGALGSRMVSGRLDIRARFAGTGGEATGEGHAEIRDGQLVDFPVLGTLAMALDLPLLRDLRFEEGALDFVLAGDVLRTPQLRFIARDVRILGRGEVLLRSGTLAHELTLLVPEAVVRRAPREMRQAFTKRPGGLMGVDFRVFGHYRAPQTDLQDRVLRGFAESLLRKGLRELFR